MIIITSAFFSCENSTMDNIEEHLNIVEVVDYTLPNELKKGIEVVNGILKFENENIAHVVFETLDNESDEYVKGLYLSCTNQEEYFNKVASGEFNENVVFEQFEDYYQFNSLRNKMDNEIAIWLKNEELDFELKPSHIIADDAMQTILNVNGEYMIGQIIYKVDLHGNIYGIKDADFESLNKLRNILDSDVTASEKSGYVIPSNVYLAQRNGNASIIFNHNLKSTTDLDLKANYSVEKIWSYDNGNKYMKGRATVTNVIGVSNFVKASTKSYSKRRFLGWRRFKVNQYASVVAYIHLKNEDGEWEKAKGKIDLAYWEDSRKVKAKYSTWPDRLRVANGQLSSAHNSDEHVYKSIHVTW